jgi:rhodanese-related sulfurtransferase
LAVNLGYKHVYGFRDGLPGWIVADYPVETIEKLKKVKVPLISAADLKGMLDSEDIVLLDARNPLDANKLWIDSPKKISIALDDLIERYAELPIGKKLVIIDVNGKRSGIAASYLSGKGFKDVVLVQGGMQQWALDGQPTVYAQ